MTYGALYRAGDVFHFLHADAFFRVSFGYNESAMEHNADTAELPRNLTVALKEWAVAIRALREGRQVMLLRKGGIREAEGEFVVEARDVLLFPTYDHQAEQAGTLQPCYGAWREEEERLRPKNEAVRIDAWARITDIVLVEPARFAKLFTFASQHIYGDAFLRFRTENEPHKPLYALFLRTFNLPSPVIVPMEPDYYGCRSWITLESELSLSGATPALSRHTYDERVRVTKRILTTD